MFSAKVGPRRAPRTGPPHPGLPYSVNEASNLRVSTGQPAAHGPTVASAAQTARGGGAGAAVDFTDARAKHLDMIHATVCQMRGASAATRRYCLTLAAVAFPASLLMHQSAILLLMLGLTVVFWLLDAGYAERRRLFQALYEEVRSEPPDQRPDFRLAPSARPRPLWRAPGMFFQGPHGFVYPAVVALLIVVGFAL